MIGLLSKHFLLRINHNSQHITLPVVKNVNEKFCVGKLFFTIMVLLSSNLFSFLLLLWFVVMVLYIIFSLWNNKQIQFEYPHEFLTCLSGYYSFVVGDEWRKVVKSLMFYTNRRRYGPYGEETGTYFTSTKDEGKIIGFHGRASSFLYAIRVHIQPSLSDRVCREPKGCPPQYRFNFYQ